MRRIVDRWLFGVSFEWVKWWEGHGFVLLLDHICRSCRGDVFELWMLQLVGCVTVVSRDSGERLRDGGSLVGEGEFLSRIGEGCRMLADQVAYALPQP